MEEKRHIIEAKMQKRDPDHQLLENLMVAMFSQRRIKIIGDQPDGRSVPWDTGIHMTTIVFPVPKKTLF